MPGQMHPLVGEIDNVEGNLSVFQLNLVMRETQMEEFEHQCYCLLH